MPEEDDEFHHVPQWHLDVPSWYSLKVFVKQDIESNHRVFETERELDFLINFDHSVTGISPHLPKFVTLWQSPEALFVQTDRLIVTDLSSILQGSFLDDSGCRRLPEDYVCVYAAQVGHDLI